MNSIFACLLAFSGASSFFLIADPVSFFAASGQAQASAPGQSGSRVPEGVILVRGASPSASDQVTPLPEEVTIKGNVFKDPYFQMSLPVPNGWTEKFKGPPPSENGRYVLADLSPADPAGLGSSGSILITAEDMFFLPLPVASAPEFIDYTKNHLQNDYKIEHLPEHLLPGGRRFSTFAYESPSSELHWWVLATEVRCHTIEIVLASRDTAFLDTAVRGLEQMKLPDEEGAANAGQFPVCIKDFARGDNLLERVDPMLTEHKFNPAPVRIIIGRDGVIRHIHFLSAFPDQVRAISDALMHWKFKPYIVNGQPVEVETGVLFGAPS